MPANSNRHRFSPPRMAMLRQITGRMAANVAADLNLDQLLDFSDSPNHIVHNLYPVSAPRVSSNIATG